MGLELPVAGGEAEDFAEAGAEVLGGVEAEVAGDVGDADIGAEEGFAGGFEAEAEVIGGGGDADLLMEESAEVRRGIAAEDGEFGEGDASAEIGLEVADGFFDFIVVGAVAGGGW